MKPISKITGHGLPLDRSDVDTDQIIPSEWLKRVERIGFGQGLFSEWREDPEFVLNLPQFNQANILVAGPNFGVGSSREHAVWALTDYGFEAVISSRFGDIFRNNATKAGLIPCVVDNESADAILRAVEQEPNTEITVDVERCAIVVGSIRLETTFQLDEFTKYRLLNGFDDIGLTLRNEDAITRYESNRASWLPST